MTGQISKDAIDLMLEQMYSNARENPDMIYISKHTYWSFVYAQQGKRYPKERRRKSKIRMGRKWRA